MQQTTVLARVCPPVKDARLLDLPASTLRVSSSKGSVSFQPGRSSCTPGKRLTEQLPARLFTFDKCFTPESNNADVFNAFSAQVLQACFSGINVSICTYGAAKTGKTHTMFGGSNDEGLISRFLKQIMGHISPKDNVQVVISHYEIYNESIRDLLAPASERRRLRGKMDHNRPQIEGLTTCLVRDEPEALNCLAKGQSARTSAHADDGSYRTSCSHSVFQLELTMTQISSTEGSCARVTSTLQFVDLAGAEGAKRSRARTKEASTINASLMTLRLVVNALAPVSPPGRSASDDVSGKDVVPYHDSLLTWLLRDTFGGNCKAFFIAAVSSEEMHGEETLSTLRMAEKLKSLQNSAATNENPSSIAARAVTKNIQLWSQEFGATRSPQSYRKGGRFSTEALHRINQPTQADYEEQVRMYKERALRAEQESKERAELLWEAFETLGNRSEGILQQAREEALQEAREALYEEIRAEVMQQPTSNEKMELEKQLEYLAEHASVLTIQLAWRRYKMRQLNSLLAGANTSDNNNRLQQMENEKQSILEELELLKIAAIQQAQDKEDLKTQLNMLRMDAERTVMLMRKTMDAAIKDKEVHIQQLREQLTKQQKTVGTDLSAHQSELKRMQCELDSAKAAIRTESEKHEKQRRETQQMREELAIRDKQLKQLQESVQQKREQAEKDAEHLRGRVQELEAMIEASQASTQKELEDRQRQVSDLEALIESLRETEAESRRLRETETEALREQLKMVEANAVEEIQRLTNQLQERGDEEAKRANEELRLLRSKIGSLELLLETNKAVTAKEVQERDRRLREIERLNAEVAQREREEIERKNRELETMEFCIKKLQKELELTKQSTSREVKDRDKKLKDLEQKLNEQLTQFQQRSVGASFMQYRRDSRKPHDSNRRLSTISVIPPAASTLISQSLAPQHQQEDLLCVRVDIESFDERSNVFYPCSSSVTPADSTTHIFNVKSPLYDLKKARWTRIRIRVLHGSVHHVDEITSICLEHHLPAGRSIMHKLRVVKTEHGLNLDGGVQAVICDWDSSASATAAFVDDGIHSAGADMGHHQCFCFQRLEESGPMTLHATFVVDGARVHWEYPLRFRNKSAVIEKIPGIGPKILLSRRASDEIKHEYLNASWFSMENESGNVRAGPVRDGQRIISFSGYLQKYQTHRSGKVQRWFVFAPPFLLCYQDAAKAAEDFTKARALPHSANRAMRVQSTTKVTVMDPEVQGMEKVEFEVVGEEKTWHLQAANKEDLDRWVSALSAWIVREKEIAPMGYDRPMNGAANAFEDDELSAGISLLQQDIQ